MVLHVALWSVYWATSVFGDAFAKGAGEDGPLPEAVVGSRNKVLDSLIPGSSPVDWCEDNYSIVSSVAEFVNTMSNFGFLIFPPVLIILFQPYGQYIQKEIHLVWGLLIVVGLCSMYFHATLSLLGQLLDEMAILWVIMLSLSIWYPDRYHLPYFRQNKRHFKVLMFFATLLCSFLGCVNPIINAFALISLGIPAAIIMMIELNRLGEGKATRLGIRSSFLWGAALFCWINDRLFCDAWSSIQFPYLHGFWHVLVCIAAYSGCVLYAYLYARAQCPNEMPVLRFWPSDKCEILSFPYVALKARRPQDPEHVKEY